jgi:hypothetical protein
MNRVDFKLRRILEAAISNRLDPNEFRGTREDIGASSAVNPVAEVKSLRKKHSAAPVYNAAESG